MFDIAILKETGFKKNFIYAGCDEVGRGPLAGPVISACVALNIKNYNVAELKKILFYFDRIGINDSKKLKENKREQIIKSFTGLGEIINHYVGFEESKKFELVLSENITLTVSIQAISPQIIDQINILNASLLSMKKAAQILCANKDGIILIDGNKKFNNDFSRARLESIVKGDSKSLVIAFASIVAKSARDKLMNKYSNKYPEYCWNENSGYPTKFHLEAIKKYGVTELHRRTFKGVSEYC